jgi:ABC-type polysaccharide/polyol phosphate transport system ATPase subunit
MRSLQEIDISITSISHSLHLIQGACGDALGVGRGQASHHGAAKDGLDMYDQDLHLGRFGFAKSFGDRSDVFEP